MRRLADEGRLPTTAGLLRDGVWTDVIGAHDHATVWPSFATGRPASEHGVYSEWVWDPDSMRMTHPTAGPPTDDLAGASGRVDRRLRRSVRSAHEPHRRLRGDGLGSSRTLGPGHRCPSRGGEPTGGGIARRRREPASSLRRARRAARITGRLGRARRPGRGGFRGSAPPGDLAARILAAVRPSLAVVVFPETHHAQGHLWHDIEPDQPHFADTKRRTAGRRPGLVEVYEEVDRQIGRLMDANEGEAPIVFSLTGNRPGRGLVDVLPAVLEHHGFARRERGLVTGRARALAAFKRRAPKALKDPVVPPHARDGQAVGRHGEPPADRTTGVERVPSPCPGTTTATSR